MSSLSCHMCAVICTSSKSSARYNINNRCFVGARGLVVVNWHFSEVDVAFNPLKGVNTWACVVRLMIVILRHVVAGRFVQKCVMLVNEFAPLVSWVTVAVRDLLTSVICFVLWHFNRPLLIIQLVYKYIAKCVMLRQLYFWPLNAMRRHPHQRPPTAGGNLSGFKRHPRS